MKRQPLWVYILFIFSILLLASRFIFVFRLVFLFILLAAAIGFLAYYFYVRWQSQKESSLFKDSVAGRIQKQLEECRTMRAGNEEELKDIRKSIDDLITGQQATKLLSEANRSESNKLLAGFQQELKLRNTKQAFFKNAEEKLESLLANHRLQSALQEKREKLQELQEDHYEELAELEELRYNLISDTTYLDTIDELAQEMQTTKTYENASSLQEKLEEMTEKIKRM